MNRRDVQTGYSGYVHKKHGWWEYGCIFSNNLVGDYETGFVFRSLMAWGKKLLLSLLVFAIMLLKRLPDGSKRMVTGVKDGYRGELSLWWFLQLCFCSVWGRWPAERGELCRALQNFAVLVCGITIPVRFCALSCLRFATWWRYFPLVSLSLLIRIISSSPDSFLIPYLFGPLFVTLAGLLNYACASGSSVSFWVFCFSAFCCNFCHWM